MSSLPSNQQLLVAIMNNRLDFAIARDHHWYRIPVTSAHKWIKERWPPQWLAFYQTKIFGPEAFSIRYYARVLDVRRQRRWQLFPDQPRNKRSNREYYQLILAPLRKLPQPILSRRWRRIVFIPTTWQKFMNAMEINDLFDDSPLEDRLWVAFKRLQIDAERQEFVRVREQDFALDFAVYCARGKIDIETDGDTWHSNPTSAAKDNLRDNSLKTSGWRVLRFNTKQIKEQLSEYTIPTIVNNINRLGGIDEQGKLPRKIDLDDGPRQLNLFDKL